MVRAVVVAFTALALLIACTEQSIDLSKCSYTATRCRPVCDYWCDSWGCYPTCWEQCWTECYQEPDLPSVTPREAGVSDAARPPPTTDAAVAVDASVDGGGTCAPCTTNDECSGGSICIRRGGRFDGGVSGFCSPACLTGNECARGFVCSSIGDGRRCLPTSGNCPAE